MKFIILFSILLCIITSQAVQTSNIIVGYKNFGKQFTINGILNPQVIGVVHSMETSFDLQLSSNITLDNTNFLFEVKIKIESFTYATLIYQFLLISRRPEFEIQNGLVLTYSQPEMNFTSNKKLKSRQVGSGGDITVHTFMTGWSSLSALGYASLVSSYDSDAGIFTITGVLADIPKGNGTNSWVIISVLLLGQSLIPQCPDSIFSLQAGIFFQNRQIAKTQNLTYFLGITQIFDYFVTMRFTETNDTITLIVGWSTMTVGYLAINTTCYAEVAGDQIVLSFFEKWKIIVIAVMAVVGILAIVGLAFFCKWWCKDEEDEEEQKKDLEESIAHLNHVKDNISESREKKSVRDAGEMNYKTPDLIIPRK